MIRLFEKKNPMAIHEMQPATVSPTLLWMAGLCPGILPPNSKQWHHKQWLFTVRMVLNTQKILGYTPSCEKAPKQANRNPGLGWGRSMQFHPFPRQGQCLSAASAQLWDEKEHLQKPAVAHAGGLEGLYPGSSDPLCSTFCSEHSSSGLSHAPFSPDDFCTPINGASTSSTIF